VSKTDKTDPWWLHTKLAEHHDHRKGECTLPPKPTTAAEYDAQPWTRYCCRWEPADWHAVKFPRPPKKWGYGAPDTRVLRQERLIVKEALAEAQPEQVIADLPTTEDLEYEARMRGPNSCRTCGSEYEYVDIDYCPEHREDD
jgi:hypothetical protein